MPAKPVFPGFSLALCLAFCSSTPVHGQSPTLLPELRVLANRDTADGTDAAIASWDREAIRSAAPRSIDEMLAREPSFSLYRRQSAIFGNPTSAGVSLRNTGATAASRTLVLLDGIPQNDPFGAWVYWARHDSATLDSIRIVPSAQSTAWGNQSPAGVIRMNRNPPFSDRAALKLGGGSQGTLGGSIVYQKSNPEMTRSVSFSAFGLHSDGFYALPASQRGLIDRKLESGFAGADLGIAWLAAPGLTVEPSLSYYHEERNNGTAMTGNSTEAMDFSLRVSSTGGYRRWQATVWHQRREFESVFSSASDDRSTETMALDQFDVPGRGTGASFTLRCDNHERWSFSGGVDGRWITGETNEDAGTFRRREAGGEQAFAGIFATTEFQADEQTRVNAAGRIDSWRLNDGRRIETSLADGSPLRADYQVDRDGIEPSASIELIRRLTGDIELRIAAGSGFRLPTLNELHRPFRVRNDIVEANPQLEAERFLSLDAGLDWQPVERIKLEAIVFHHWISDAIANVPVTDPGEIAGIFGTLPPDGTGSQRRNVEEAQVAGVEGRIAWDPVDEFSLDLSGLWSDTRFSSSPAQPLLQGKPFAQAPDLRLIALAEWRVYQARIENLFDEEIQTGLSSDGLRTLAAPRSLWVGAEWAF